MVRRGPLASSSQISSRFTWLLFCTLVEGIKDATVGIMESEPQHSYAAHHVGRLSLSLGGLGQVATKNTADEDMLSLQLKSWSQTAHQTCFDPGKTNHGSSFFFESSIGQGQSYAISSQFQNVTVPEEGLSLTLGFANAFASGLSSSKCGGYTQDRGKSLNGDERGHTYVDLGLGLGTNRGFQLNIGPLAREGATSTINRETPEGWQDASYGAGVLGSAQEGGVLGKGSAHEGVLSSLPCNDPEEIDLQLGLSGSSLSLDSDCASLDVQEARVDAANFGHIPVVDEGSTSARLMKSGGNVVPFLGCRLATETPSSSHMQACMMSARALETDTVMLQTSSMVPVDDGDSAVALEGSKNVSFSRVDASVRLHMHATGNSNASCPTAERSTKTCKFKGCSKGARGASGLCIAHGGGRRCQRFNCNKGAEGRTMFCKAHGGGRRCQTLGCIKSAEGRTDFCIAHGGGRRCTFDGCSKAARGRSGLCIRHGGGKRCQRDGCTKSAEGFSGLCISHGGGRRCQYPDCGKGAQGSTKFCKGHGGGRRCEFEGCTKGAEGSTPFCKAHGGGKRCMFGGGICTKSVHGGTSFCVAHGGGKRCSVPGCTKSARGRTDFCVRHGGGKRCKFEDCNKSAQGSTDYCKAHGGGKRCLWGQEGSVYDGSMLDEGSIHGLQTSCDKFARGKAGLCSAHSNLLEQYQNGLSSTTSLQGSISEQLHPKQPHSELSEQTSQLDEEQHSSFVEHQLGSIGEGSWRSQQQVSSPVVFKAQQQVSSPVVFKAQSASRRCVATDASWQDTADGFALENSPSNEYSTCQIPGEDPYLCNRAASSTLPIPFELMLQTSKACLQREFAAPSSQIQMQTMGPNALQQFGDSIDLTPLHEDPEGRVHGGGHFMALLTRKASGYYQ
ncbi:hypothetical protein GOP47_0021802 [Adiantum capillus-veneris]|uniref:WRKY19-like zinc finger domain-containing protein n=1 Tax=Adiantum capillus-veneris TaxID=13818 RepID=A0A9D4U8T6_ADICA|nr:hypothetical protein GOP47_0021802 [Adiantum capillus-veneris]